MAKGHSWVIVKGQSPSLSYVEAPYGLYYTKKLSKAKLFKTRQEARNAKAEGVGERIVKLERIAKVDIEHHH